ncbi:MAG TPA: pyridoxal-dependent decarboxylase [Candidatus Saccharimonadales bacterium]
MNAVDQGIDFKLREVVRQKDSADLESMALIDALPTKGISLEDVQKEFNERFLPYCYNFASPNFMGFPDAGNSIAAITGNLTADFLQQNLINQSFCSPSGTFAEISVIRWLREVVGYSNPAEVRDIFDVGGVITGGGTTSNAIGILLARENHKPDTMKTGVHINDDFYLVVPKGIGHYSVKSAQMWVGCGNRLLEVETDGFRYDLQALKTTLETYKGRIMGLVAYAGDSRTMTVEHFDKVASLVKSIDPTIWLHADACHGFSLGFSDELRKKLKGIELFDSITTDPHKVLNAPYTISSLLVKDPAKMRTVSSTSDLIMQEQFAFGQITPFIGSKPWMSLKLWFAIKHLGREGFGRIIDARHQLALDLADLISETTDFTLINKVDINSVAFVYTGGNKNLSVDQLNNLNRTIHGTMLREGHYHLHQFSIPDAGIIKKGEIIYPLRFMSGNPNTTKQHLIAMLEYTRKIGREVQKNI